MVQLELRAQQEMQELMVILALTELAELLA